MKVRTFLLSSIVLLSACWEADNTQQSVQPNASATAIAGTPAATPTPGGAVAISERTPLYLFEYSWPQKAGEVPALAELLNRRAERAKTDLVESAEEGKEAAEDSGFPYNAYSYSQDWKVVANTPRFLSLSSVTTGYRGGAHGIYASGSLVWDREADKALKPVALFVSPGALEGALAPKYCDELDRQRGQKRGEDIGDGTDNLFDSCPSFSDLTVLLGSSNGRAFNRIGLIADPYVAGPWAEGTYEVTLPVTPDVLGAVRPEYAGAFAARR